MQSTAGVTADEARDALARVLGSARFVAAERRKALLTYLAEQSLQGIEVKEFIIGVQVYGRDPAVYDPRVDPVVRVDIGRLRTKLREYYEDEGRADPVRIDMPKGAYTVFFEASTPVEAPVQIEQTSLRRRWRPWGVGVAVIGVVILILGGWGVYRWNQLPAFRSVVVLPFQNLTGDPENEYLADGITEELTDSLAHIPSLLVVARTSAFQFKGKGADVREIGRRLNVEAVVEGSLRKSNGRIRVTVQVNRAANGFRVLSRTFEEPSQELGKLKDDMIRPVAAVLRATPRSPTKHHADPEAYNLYLKSRAQRGRGTIAAFEQAVSYLNRAIDVDPAYADAYAGLATAYASAAVNFAPEPLAYAKNARAAASRALELDPAEAQALAAQGLTDALIFFKWAQGEEKLKHAIELMPESAINHQWMALR